MDNQVVTQINIDNNEIKSYYDKNRDSFKHKNSGAKILHFLVSADSVARRIANTLKQSNTSVDRKEFLANYNVDVAVVEGGELITPLDLTIFSNNRINNIIGPIARPDMILIVSGLPKTRSGKIMRRILRKIASDDYSNFGDISTLLDPSVVEEIIEKSKS